ncbi:unnamed protein product [Allacma fusca]|uniref:Uncharacterized protein n=1 Tax=Allacma fusca TaxID=39272 RepID=A0A8J2LC07_9HEXA|nr:unnamed protein product [Allacma fusca]
MGRVHRQPTPNSLLFSENPTFLKLLPKYDQMIVECEKLTKIQQLEYDNQIKFCSKSPGIFVDRGVMFMETCPEELKKVEINIPYNPSAIQIKFFSDVNSRIVKILNDSPAEGSRESIIFRPQNQKVVNCEANFEAPLNFLGENFDFKAKYCSAAISTDLHTVATPIHSADQLPPYEDLAIQSQRRHSSCLDISHALCCSRYSKCCN